SAAPEAVEQLQANIAQANPKAAVIAAASPITVDDPVQIRGKRVLVVEDGPTLTHGEMAFGAGTIAAQRLEAGSLVDPRPHAVGSIGAAFEESPHRGTELPALGSWRRHVEAMD